jgi:hypothetical protein
LTEEARKDLEALSQKALFACERVSLFAASAPMPASIEKAEAEVEELRSKLQQSQSSLLAAQQSQKVRLRLFATAPTSMRSYLP